MQWLLAMMRYEADEREEIDFVIVSNVIDVQRDHTRKLHD